MIAQMETLFGALETKKRTLLEDLKSFSDDRLHFQPAPDRWSMAMAVQHLVLGERGLRSSEEELRDNPVRRQLRAGRIFDTVMEILEKDVPVDVPHPGLEPDNRVPLRESVALWDRERKRFAELLEGIPDETADEVRFSHPAAGPLDAVRALRLAHAHFDTHRRQIDRLISETEVPA